MKMYICSVGAMLELPQMISKLQLISVLPSGRIGTNSPIENIRMKLKRPKHFDRFTDLDSS